MTRTKQISAALIAGVSLLGLSAAPASAGHFEEFSEHHTTFGVSQFNALDLDNDDDMVLNNPIHVTQVAAVLLYERGEINYSHDGQEFFFNGSTGDFPLERYFACMVVKLTPHASLDLNWDDPSGLGETYAEVIFVPEQPVRVAIAALGGQKKSRRLADGLGGQAVGEGDRESRGFHLVHPGLFSLPDETVDFEFNAAINQQEAARQCICQGLFDLVEEPFNNLTTPLRVFEPFGITCP